MISSSDLGDILVSGSGHTLYLYTPDNQCQPTCGELRGDANPRLLGPAVAGEGVDESLLGTTTRTDGTVQATYNGWPLYFNRRDLLPSLHYGQGESDLWWVIDASGNAVGR
jgi:predicted lipoprotein with Yx(FWY)xxD motif